MIRPSILKPGSSSRFTVAFSSQARIFASAKGSPQATDHKSHDEEKHVQDKAQDSATKQKSTKTQAQLDEELRQKMMGLAGDGGDAGVEYEDGQPVSMKRSVKNNMFRYI